MELSAARMTGTGYPAARFTKVAVFIGTAGWSIPRHHQDSFPSDGTALERYAARFAVTEINSSFHRPHRISTWERWRDSVPKGFRFSVKMPKQITHARKLVGCEDALVQLAPSLAFDADLARNFFKPLAVRTAARVVCEPRHVSWFGKEADELLEEVQVARVAADPPVCDAAVGPGAWRGLGYWRLHGSPVIYRSSYEDRLHHYATQLRREEVLSGEVWCIFDNTASSAGAGDALALMRALDGR
jgi:uncharacterized protein YecE (DUF72 family)